jgi:hypothetical protein
MTGEAEQRSGISKRTQQRIGAKQQGADTCYTQREMETAEYQQDAENQFLDLG